MITLTTQSKLGIILPNTNKALSEALRQATPEQLRDLSEGKDIKSLLNGAFAGKINGSKSDTVLLDLLKNNPVFKTMGTVAETASQLSNALKSFPEHKTPLKALDSVIEGIGQMKSDGLREKIGNSGILLESKIAAAISRPETLLATLEKISLSLGNLSSKEASAVKTSIKTLTDSPHIAESAHSPSAAASASESVREIARNLQNMLSKTDSLYSENASRLLNVLKNGDTAEIRPALSQLFSLLLNSTAPETDHLLDGIEKLLRQNASEGEELNKLTAVLEKAVDKKTELETLSVLQESLETFSSSETLLNDPLIDTAIKDDLKAALLKLSEELKTSDHPDAPSLLEHTDRLLMQIDYHQLLSTLQNGTSFYLPFSWDSLEEGSLNFRKAKAKTFYCEINLRLKEFGELDLMMGLYDQNQLEIQAFTEKKELKEALQEHLGDLRSVLIEAGMTLRRIRVLERSAQTSAAVYDEALFDHSGFETKV